MRNYRSDDYDYTAGRIHDHLYETRASALIHEDERQTLTLAMTILYRLSFRAPDGTSGDDE